ncbi:hypothetical protein [Pontiella sulfatireligans]|uniref:Fibronectin type-III domain-containing protein n=1 Tax=Pontiella sulfatireligans TaxID=2750658 RepID=A0A6C2UHF6_9BACT|nr:hypothetical protein [Pontiella sulfatireligans]VGO19625.1 hypothetical protein SCARR_01684 [Pontiella sulfatireligans]
MTNQVNNIFDPLGLFAQAYFWRIDEYTSTGTVKGSVWNFSVPSAFVAAPAIVNTPAIDISDSSATIGGQITDGGTGSKVWMYWWPDAGTTNEVYMGVQAGAFQLQLSGLESNVLHNYRCFAENSYGSNWTTVSGFTTTNSGSEPPSIWTELTYDDFESGFGNYTDGGANCFLYTGGTYAHQENNAVNIERFGEAGSFYLTNPIDLHTLDYTQIKIEFWFYAVSMDPTEDFFVEYHDGSTWQRVATYARPDFNNGQFYFKEILIEETGYTFPANMNVRFICDASGGGDDVYIDEVRISGLAPQVELSPYNEWLVEFNLSETNILADSDFDGMNNLVEYGLGGNPTNIDAPIVLPTSGIDADTGMNWLEYVYRRRTDAAVRGLEYRVEAGTNLVEGVWLTNDVQEVASGLIDAGFESVTNRLDIGLDSESFIRLRIQQN